jgi:hypothetical protein
MWKVFSFVCGLIFLYALFVGVPWMWNVYSLVAENPEGKLTGIQQFAGIIVVGVNSAFLVGALVCSGFGAVIPWLPPGKPGSGTNNTGPR